MKLLFTLLPFCLLFSCTITKRHFGAGYHIEWKRDHPSEKKSSPNDRVLLQDDFLSDAEILEPGTFVSDDNITMDSIVPDSSKPFSPKLILREEQEDIEIGFVYQGKGKQQQLRKYSDNEKVIEDQRAIEEEPKKVEKFTWFALGYLGLISLLLMIFSLIGIFSNFSGIVLIVLGLLLMIFSIVSVVRIRKNPDKYKAKWLAWTLLGVGTVGIGAVLFMVVYYLLFITNNVGFL